MENDIIEKIDLLASLFASKDQDELGIIILLSKVFVINKISKKNFWNAEKIRSLCEAYINSP